jgi:hypothetical protein
MYEHMTGSQRSAWPDLPPSVAAALGRLLGSEIVSAQSQPGGFSEGLAARVGLADGRRAFIKATASPVAAFHRREALVAEALHATGLVPRLLAVHDEAIPNKGSGADSTSGGGASERGTPERSIPDSTIPDSTIPDNRSDRGIANSTIPDSRIPDNRSDRGIADSGAWVALAFEEVDGHLPAQPWRLSELERVLRELTTLADVLTPSPVSPALLAPPRLGGWRELAGGDLAGARLPRWALRNLDGLVALEEKAAQALAGDTLLHGDLYPFNLLLTPDRVVAVDWPHAWIGARFCDALTVLSSAALSGIDPQALADEHPLTRDLDPLRVNTFLAVHAGFLLRVAALAGPATDPRLVSMMTRLGTASLTWLRRRW